MTDPRNGNNYKTVIIGSQTWMTENLNYSTGTSWCYDNNSRNCITYGCLYDWQTARSACPSGWHLPSKSEFETLLLNSGGAGSAAYSNLIKSSSWSASLSGWRYNGGVFGSNGQNGCWWSSSANDVGGAWTLLMHSSFQEASMSGYDPSCGFSVRCLKD